MAFSLIILNEDNFENEFDFIKNLGVYFKDFVHDNAERKKDLPYTDRRYEKINEQKVQIC